MDIRSKFAGFLLALPLVALPECCEVAAPVQEPEQAPAQEQLRFLTFNIYGDWRAPRFGVEPRKDGIVETILRLKPDIASLQEVSYDWWDCGLFAALSNGLALVQADVAEALRHSGPPPPPHKDLPVTPVVDHTPLLYRADRLNLLDSGYEFFHISLGPGKSFTWAVFEDKRSGRRFMAFATHFWHKHKSKEDDALRELAVRCILRRVADVRRNWGDIPVIGGGDLNCVQGSPALETFRREGYSNAMEVAAEKTARSATRTYHGRLTRDENGLYHGTPAPPGKDKPEQSIDHVFFNGGISALKYDIELDPKTLDSSDHSPVIVDFAIK